MLKTIDTTKDIKTGTVPLLPLRDIVVFPDMVAPLLAGRLRSIKALDETMTTDKLVFLATQKDLRVDDPREEEIYKIGTVAEVLQHLKLPDGSVKLLVEGKFRARVKKFVANKDFYIVQMESIETDCKKNIEIEALMRSLKTQFEEFGIKNGKSMNNLDVHIHVPEGAIPKDGPSAGITMATALVSSFTKCPVKRGITMTGEITLRGNVLPVGGIKAKFLAAHRAGIKSIIFPKENKKDIIDIPKNILKKMKLIPVENMDEVLKVALKH